MLNYNYAIHEFYKEFTNFLELLDYQGDVFNVQSRVCDRTLSSVERILSYDLVVEHRIITEEHIYEDMLLCKGNVASKVSITYSNVNDMPGEVIMSIPVEELSL